MGLIVDGLLGTRSAAVLSLYGFGGPRLRGDSGGTKGYANQTLVVRKMTRFHWVIC